MIEVVGVASGSVDRLPQPGDRRLRDRQAARGHDRDDPLARLLEDEHLAIGRDVVEPGIGPGVRQQHHALVQQQAHAIGHRRPLSGPTYCWAAGHATVTSMSSVPPPRADARGSAPHPVHRGPSRAGYSGHPGSRRSPESNPIQPSPARQISAQAWAASSCAPSLARQQIARHVARRQSRGVGDGDQRMGVVLADALAQRQRLGRRGVGVGRRRACRRSPRRPRPTAGAPRRAGRRPRPCRLPRPGELDQRRRSAWSRRSSTR